MENKEKMIQKAGAIILSSKDRKNIALLYRGRQNDWSFPKGHVELGENDIQTMVREIQEETGLSVNIIKDLPDHFYISPREGKISTKMFLASSEDDLKLKLEFKEDDIKFIPCAEVIEKLSYDNLKEYFASVIKTVEEVF